MILFFFQAEDGIRDYKVTGVQTCALPIWRMYPLEFQRGDESIEVAGNYRIAANDSNAYTAAVLAGFGIAQLVTAFAQPLIDSGELVEVLPEWTQPPLPIHVVYPPHRHLSAKVRAFVDWAADLFARPPQLQRS